jgi:single-stranded DNA-binding protein
MITITATGRLAAHPELRTLPAGGVVCEFRLLSTRFAGGQEHTEAVTFFCFGEDAEKFCKSTEKGQMISATGVQETSKWTDANGASRTYIKYKMTWNEKGPRSRASRQSDGATDRPPFQQESGSSAPKPMAAHRTPASAAISKPESIAQPPQEASRAPQPEFDDVSGEIRFL